MGTMRIMGSEGDTKLIWDSANSDETDVARETFKKLTKKGFKAFSVNKKGDKNEEIDEFDAKAEKIIMVPQISGG